MLPYHFLGHLLKRAPEEVALFTLPRTLPTMIRQHACGYPGEADNEPGACCAIPVVATVWPGTRSRQEVMVPTSSQMASCRTFADLSPLELSGESSQFDTNEPFR
jgi:hypothetical protein